VSAVAEIALWILLCVTLAAWCIGGAAWFAGLFAYAGPNDDFPRASRWQYLAGGPLIWLLLFLVWRKERSYVVPRHNTEPRG